MKQRTSHPSDRAALTAAEIDAILRRAYAQRDTAMAQAICLAFRGLAAAFRRFGRAVDEARRLQALATLDDRRLTALGIARADLPAIIYGWPAQEAPERLPVADIEIEPPAPRQRAA